MQMFNAEHLQEKWAPLLDYQGLDGIKDSHRRMVTAVLWRIKKNSFVRKKISLAKHPTLVQLVILPVSLVVLLVVVQLQVSILF